jgi:predicted RNase H-like HicB family nuclease
LKYKYRILIEKDENDIYIASCPALQGFYSQGDTVDEALQNIKDSIQLHIEARQALGEPVPIEILIEEVEVIV